MCYLDGYITVIRLTDWSRAVYHSISIQITHGYLVLRIHLMFESFRTRPSTCVGTVRALAQTRDCSNAVRVSCDCSGLRNLRQTSAPVPSYGTNTSCHRPSSMFTSCHRPSSMFPNVGSEKVCPSVNLSLNNGNNIVFVDVILVLPEI